MYVGLNLIRDQLPVGAYCHTAYDRFLAPTLTTVYNDSWIPEECTTDIGMQR